MTNECASAAITHRLIVPLDASQATDAAAGVHVKVALFGSRGIVAAQTVELDAKGQGSASFALAEPPQRLKVVVGPPDAADEDLEQLQTIMRSFSLRAAREEVRLAPIVISDFYLRWWPRWCRTFTVRGRVVCSDGSPVPGATVCAFDTDSWWWWYSKQQVGCAVTAADGTFKIVFKFCCGFLPIWWARARHFQLDPAMVERLTTLLAREGQSLRRPPSPMPSLSVFDAIVAPHEPAMPARTDFDFTALPGLRERLLGVLPFSEELAQARIWPWVPWTPWWDCAPDLTFRVTQKCDGQERVIVDEGALETRWNVPTELDVSLVARSACCIREDPTPEGNCIVIARVCDDIVDNIGGNPGAPASPAGYLSPGAISVGGDRPYAGLLPISGLFGSGAQADYYEFEWATAAAGPWNAMPPAAAGGFDRVYWGPQLGGGPVGFHSASFPFTPISGRLVVESREHFEAANDPLSWGTTRFWVSNRDLLFSWLTAGNFADGTYHLRVRSHRASGGALTTSEILPLCDTEHENHLVVTLDNATSPLEPAADVVDVRIGGASAGPCSNVDASDGGSLEIDFVAYDVDEHLAFYSLIATYGKNLAVNLLSAPGATLTPVALGTVPAAEYVGPDYAAVRSAPTFAPGPHWRAGGLRLTIPDARSAFPETCCYQIELRVYKRPVVSCSHNFSLSKLSYYSLTVVV